MNCEKDALYGYSSLPDFLRRSSGAQQTRARLVQTLGDLQKIGLVIDGKKR